MYRLVEQEYNDGRVAYIVEREIKPDEWQSVYRSADIEAARAVLHERRQNQVAKKSRVIE